ncbi:MAG: preprotein translocase subunit SecY [Clostridia bacterium]|nr:preprotein translocase subunit SecY [Clostridia bacterium]
MFQTFKNAWKTPDLKKKILFTAMILLLYRIGACLYVPYVDVDAVQNAARFQGILEFVDMLSGEALSKATLFALSVSPYITASIVMQLLTIAIPALERISKQGEEGKKKITAYTRWVTVALALITAYGYVKLLDSIDLLTVKSGDKFYVFAQIVMIACFCAGAALIMWLGEQINAHGIGNGISMILFANILSSFTSMVLGMIRMVTREKGWWIALGIGEVILSLALALGAIMLIVWFTNSERRIPIQYAKRVVGRKMYGGQSSNLPLKMNMAGVMPVIFASSIVSIPATIAGFMTKSNWFTKFVNNWFNYTSPLYIAVFVVLIVLFSYFYIMISFNPVEVANNIRNNGGAIPGIRPGKPTSDYIKKILNRITMMGAIFLVVISALPMIITAVTSAFGVSFQSFAFMGTSLLIVVGVALETVRDLEAQLAMRNYKGFLD